MVSADTIFAALQIKEKCYEQQMDLNQDFIDLSKDFKESIALISGISSQVSSSFPQDSSVVLPWCYGGLCKCW